jgi:twitching motility protein PilT
VAIFDGLKKNKALQRLSDGKWKNDKDFQDLVADLKGMDLAPTEILWTLSNPSNAVRNFGAEIVLEKASPAVAAAVYAETQGKNPHAERFILGLFMRFPEDMILEVLKGQAQDKDPAARRQAFDLLAQLPLEKTGSILLDVLSGDEPEARQKVLEKLAQDPKFAARPEVKERLTPLANDPDPAVRAKILDILVTINGDRELDLVLDRFLHDDSPDILEVAIAHLSDWARERLSKELQAKLVPLLEEGDNDLRQRTVRVLLNIPDTAGVLRAFIHRAKSLAGWIRERAMETLQEFEESLIEPVVELLGDPEDDVRVSGLMLAAFFEDPRLVEPIIRLMKDPDWWLRITAAQILGKLGDARAVDVLIEALKDEDLKWTAVGSLGAIGDPRALRPIAGLLSDPAAEVRLEVLNALEKFGDERVLPLVEKCASLDPSLEVRERASKVHAAIAKANDKTGQAVTQLGDVATLTDPTKLSHLDALLVAAREQGASDIHVRVGVPPTFRTHGRLAAVEGEEPLTAAQTQEMLLRSLNERQRKVFDENHQLDYCYAIPNVGRYRGNVYSDRLGLGGAFRVIPNRIPTFEELRLPLVLKRFADFHQGLIIIAGSASCGKTTTLAAIIDMLNNSKRDHILTMEDPIEFVHTFKNCLVNQREVGKHTASFAAALRGALRQDPDVIVVGEMRDPETLNLALTASGTGHLVIGTLHTTSAHKTVDRMIDSFPPGEQPAVRVALSESLKAVVCQSLLPRADGEGRVPAFEILFMTGPLSNMIRDNKTIMIPSVMQTGKLQGMRTLDDSLKELLDEGLITAETAYNRANSKAEFEPFLPPEAREMIRQAQEVKA